MITEIVYKLKQQKTIDFWETLLTNANLSVVEVWYNRNTKMYPTENFKIVKVTIISEEEIIRDSRV